jgi:CRP/FNR family cyclic AMP-dependent transcriptional regulator
MGSATAMTDCVVLRIDKKAMMEALHREHELSDMFVAYLLARNIRYEEDLLDQLLNSSEKQLARILLLLAHFGKEGKPESVVPKIGQEMLAEMTGTTRSRVSFFMNRFRKLGFVNYNGGLGGLRVHSSLLSVVLHRLGPLSSNSRPQDLPLLRLLRKPAKRSVPTGRTLTDRQRHRPRRESWRSGSEN